MQKLSPIILTTNHSKQEISALKFKFGSKKENYNAESDNPPMNLIDSEKSIVHFTILFEGQIFERGVRNL